MYQICGCIAVWKKERSMMMMNAMMASFKSGTGNIKRGWRWITSAGNWLRVRLWICWDSSRFHVIHQIGFSSRCFHDLDPPLCGASLISLGSATNFSGGCCLVYPFGISWDFFGGIFGGCHFSRSWDSLLMVKAFLISLGSATKFTWWMLLNLSFWDLLGFFWDSLGFHFSRNWDLLLMVKASLISLGSATKFVRWILLNLSFRDPFGILLGSWGILWGSWWLLLWRKLRFVVDDQTIFDIIGFCNQVYQMAIAYWIF